MKEKKSSYTIVDSLTKDINDLEKRIEHVGTENFKKVSIRNIKIFARFIQLIGPYLLAIIIPFVAQSFIFDIPFYPENVKQEKCYMMELDNKGVISYQSKYSHFENENSKLYIYGKWILGSDGFYQRSIKEYYIRDISIDEVKELIYKENLEIEDILGEPLKEIVEHKNILSDEELNEDSYLKAIKYYVDSNDFIIVRQSIGEDILYSVLYLIITLIANYPIFKFRSDYSNFDFSECVEKLKAKYQKTDVKILEKKLEIRKDNYKRLTGCEYGE